MQSELRPKKPLVLLGAGASAEAGIPTTVAMTQKMIECFTTYTGEEEVKILCYVVGRLLCWPALKEGISPHPIDIEVLFATVEALAKRQELLITPFVDRWDSLLEKLGDSEPIFKRTNDTMLYLLAKMIWLDDPKKVKYLAPLVQQGREETFTIATLNYDNAIELACKTIAVPICIGLEHWLQDGEFRKPEKGIELLKLHGSIDWKIDEHPVWKRGTIANRRVQPVAEDKVRQQAALQPERREIHLLYRPALIFGAGNKLTAQGPFLDLLHVFQQRLNEHDALLVIGYSFRDEHINEIITSWINQQGTRRKIIWIDREGARPTDNIFYRANFSTLRDKFEPRPVGASKGIADFFH